MPTFTRSQRTGTEGQLEVGLLLQRELAFLPHFVEQAYDTGIDIIVETTRIGEGEQIHPEAKFFGAQVKSGESYFKTVVADGWVYSGAISELEHWLRSSLAVVLVLHQSAVGTWWVEVTDTNAQREGDRFRIVVPRSQMLTRESREHLRSIATGEPRTLARWESGHSSSMEVRLTRGHGEVLLNGHLLAVDWSYDVLTSGNNGGERWRVGRDGTSIGVVLHEYEQFEEDDTRSAAQAWLLPLDAASYPAPLLERPLSWVHEFLLSDIRPSRVGVEAWTSRVRSDWPSGSYGEAPHAVSCNDLPLTFLAAVEQLFQFQWLGMRSRHGVSVAWYGHQSVVGRSVGVDVIGFDHYAVGLKLFSEGGQIAELVVTSSSTLEGSDEPATIAPTAVIYFRELVDEERFATAGEDAFPLDGFGVDIPTGLRSAS